MLRNALFSLALAAGVHAAQAADMPVPKVMSDAPTDKGAWRMEMLEVPPEQAQQLKAMGPMTICQTAGEAMARDSGQKSECKARLVEDSASRAVMELNCPGNPPHMTRSVITREGPKSYLAQVETGEAGKMKKMKMRMTYAGPCSAGDSVMKMDKDSPACKQVRAQMAQMNPATQCKGANREQCVKALEGSLARMRATCPQ